MSSQTCVTAFILQISEDILKSVFVHNIIKVSGVQNIFQCMDINIEILFKMCFVFHIRNACLEQHSEEITFSVNYLFKAIIKLKWTITFLWNIAAFYTTIFFMEYMNYVELWIKYFF